MKRTGMRPAAAVSDLAIADGKGRTTLSSPIQ